MMCRKRSSGGSTPWSTLGEVRKKSTYEKNTTDTMVKTANAQTMRVMSIKSSTTVARPALLPRKTFLGELSGRDFLGELCAREG